MSPGIEEASRQWLQSTLFIGFNTLFFSTVADGPTTAQARIARTLVVLPILYQQQKQPAGK